MSASACVGSRRGPARGEGPQHVGGVGPPGGVVLGLRGLPGGLAVDAVDAAERAATL